MNLNAAIKDSIEELSKNNEISNDLANKKIKCVPTQECISEL